MVIAAGYLYFFSDNEKISLNPDNVKVDQGMKLKFIHPVYQYSLDLPYSWKGKYRVLEERNQTQFWYIDETGQDLLFSIKRQPVGELVTATNKNKRLGQVGDFLYVLIIPSRTSKALSVLGNQMRQEVETLGSSFSFLEKSEADLEIIKILSESLQVKATSSIVLPVFETLAMRENATSTDYYIWFSARSFAWDNFRLRDWPVDSKPAVVAIYKDNNSFSIKIPRTGVNFNPDVKKIFPDSIRSSAVFTDMSVEHSTMLDKMSSRLDEIVASYFGSEPTLIRAGVIQGVKVDQNGLNLIINLAESVKLSAGATYSVLNVSKTASSFIISSSTESLSLPEIIIKNKLGKVIATTSPQLLPVSQWLNIFSKNSTSTWRTKPFWFEIQDGIISRIYPI